MPVSPSAPCWSWSPAPPRCGTVTGPRSRPRGRFPRHPSQQPPPPRAPSRPGRRRPRRPGPTSHPGVPASPRPASAPMPPLSRTGCACAPSSCPWQSREDADVAEGGGRVDRQQQEQFRDFALARWPTLLRTAILLSPDQRRAELLVQRTLVLVHRDWEHSDRRAAPEAWARSVLVRLSLDGAGPPTAGLTPAPQAATPDTGRVHRSGAARRAPGRGGRRAAAAGARRAGAAPLRRAVRGRHRPRPELPRTPPSPGW